MIPISLNSVLAKNSEIVSKKGKGIFRFTKMQTARAENAVGKNPNVMQLPYGIGLYPRVHIK